eukprot:6445021-Lingulodinium_polyedra.AAC.1
MLEDLHGNLRRLALEAGVREPPLDVYQLLPNDLARGTRDPHVLVRFKQRLLQPAHLLLAALEA